MILGTHNRAPTGRTRYRSERRWGRERLILQIEERGRVTTLIGPFPDTEDATWWRDATTEDLKPEPADAARQPVTATVPGDKSREDS